MSDNYPPRAGFSRDSIVAIAMLALVALAIASVLIFNYLRPETFTATALFNIATDEISYTGEPIPFDPRGNEILRKTQVAYLKSYFVMQAALRTPGVGALAILAPYSDKVKWLQDNLHVSFYDEDSEILQIELSGTEEQSEDLRQIVDSVCDAYLKEVVFETEQRRLVFHDAKERAAANLRKKLEKLIKDRNEANDNSPAAIAAREVGETEIKALTKSWELLLSRSALDDMEASSPDRIRRIQPATVSSDDHPLPGKQ